MTYVLHFFYPTALATAYSQKPKFVRAEHLATAEDENCSYGPTLQNPRNKGTLFTSYQFSSFQLHSGGNAIIDRT